VCRTKYDKKPCKISENNTVINGVNHGSNGLNTVN
jgi:hypothetical protein